MKTIEERFWEKVDKRSQKQCWLWKAGLSAKGYGAFRIGSVQTTAHRVAYQLTHGEILPGLVVCHHCDVPNCVNPSHLFVGTYRDNMRDAVRKGRLANGENIPWAKVTEERVLAARRMYADGISQVEIGRILGIQKANVWPIVHGKSWKHVL